MSGPEGSSVKRPSIEDLLCDKASPQTICQRKPGTQQQEGVNRVPAQQTHTHTILPPGRCIPSMETLLTGSNLPQDYNIKSAGFQSKGIPM